jgi:hypothetical protein
MNDIDWGGLIRVAWVSRLGLRYPHATRGGGRSTKP